MVFRGSSETGWERAQTGPEPVACGRRVSTALLIAGLNLAFAWDARRTYESFSPLDFPGSRHVRVEPDKAAALRGIVSRINSSCSTLLTEPGLFSFHLWTGKPSPGGVDHQLWMSLLDDATQDAIVEKLSAIPELVSSTSRSWPNTGLRREYQGKPMVRYIRENFHTVIEGYGYSLMMRKRPAGLNAALVRSRAWLNPAFLPYN
jgi:hypothetical protein